MYGPEPEKRTEGTAIRGKYSYSIYYFNKMFTKTNEYFQIMATRPYLSEQHKPATIMCCMAILPDKSKATYVKMLQLLTDKLKNVSV